MNPINFQISVTLDYDILSDLVRRAVISAMGIDPQREARVRAPQHANFGGQKPPKDKGLLIDTRQAAKLLMAVSCFDLPCYRNSLPVRLFASAKQGDDCWLFWLFAMYLLDTTYDAPQKIEKTRSVNLFQHTLYGSLIFYLPGDRIREILGAVRPAESDRIGV